MGVGPGPQIQVKNNRDNSLNGEGTATVHHAINRASCQLRPPQSCGQQQQQPVERAEDAISTDQLVSASHRLGRNEAVERIPMIPRESTGHQYIGRFQRKAQGIRARHQLIPIQ